MKKRFFCPPGGQETIIHLRIALYPNLCYYFVEFTFLGQWWADSKVTLVLENAEDIKMMGKDHTIVIMNHKYEVDWLMTWIMAERFGLLGVSTRWTGS